MARKKATRKAAGRGGTIRCGVIGLGRIGWSHHCKIILEHKKFDLAAVCDREAGRVEEARAASGCAGYADWKQLIADGNVDLVVVASQSQDHEPMSIAALQAGKDVLCEKPAAIKATGVDRMIRAARKAGRVLTVHQNHRTTPEFWYIREILEKGWLGEIFRVKRAVANFARRNDWQVLRKYGGGLLNNWGVHLVDQCLLLLDSPVKEMYSDMRQVINPGDAEDDIKILLRGENGRTVDIDLSSACAAPLPNWVLMGTCGTLSIQGATAHLKYFDPRRLKTLRVEDSHMWSARTYGASGAKIPWKEKEEPAQPKKKHPSFYDMLYDSLRKGTPLFVEPEQVLRTHRILDRVRRKSGY